MKKEATTAAPEIMWGPERTEKLWRNAIAAGGGIALLAILRDQLRSQKRKIDADKMKTPEGTLTMTLPPLKQAAFIDIAGGAAAGAGTYYALQQLYKLWRKKQLEQEISDADKDYVDSLVATTKPQVKQAGMPPLTEILAGAPKDTLFWSALAAGAGTYGLLENTWPKVSEKPQSGKPKKIVIKGYGTVFSDGEGDGPLAEMDKGKAKSQIQDVEAQTPTDVAVESKPVGINEGFSWLKGRLNKAAFAKADMEISMGFGEDDQKCAAEMLTFILSEMPNLKLASSPLAGLVGAHARDPRALCEWMKEAGAEATIELFGMNGAASYYELDAMEKKAAIHNAYREGALRPTLTVLALAELSEVYPELGKRAQVVAADPEISVLLTKLAALQWQLNTTEESPNEKSAAVNAMQNDMRRQMGTLGISESEDAGGQMDAADDAYNSEDPIDKFMAGSMV